MNEWRKRKPPPTEIIYIDLTETGESDQYPTGQVGLESDGDFRNYDCIEVPRRDASFEIIEVGPDSPGPSQASNKATNSSFSSVLDDLKDISGNFSESEGHNDDARQPQNSSSIVDMLGEMTESSQESLGHARLKRRKRTSVTRRDSFSSVEEPETELEDESSGDDEILRSRYD